MKDLERHETGGEVCPKRLWVMTTLSDDDLTEGEAALPQGLRFHLARCESCRALADRLLTVTECLHKMGQLEPAVELAGSANAQAHEALCAGAKFTGRIEIPDGPESEWPHPRGIRWAFYGKCAAAAVIVFGIGMYVGSNYVNTQRHALVREDAGGAGRATQQPGASVDPSQVEPAGDRLAGEIPGPEPPSKTRGEQGKVETAVVDGAQAPLRDHLRPRSPIDAARVDDPNYVPRAFFLPDPTQRTLGAGPAIDNQRPSESTIESDSLLRDGR